MVASHAVPTALQMSLEAFATRQVTHQKGFEFLRQNISTADKPTPSRSLTVMAKDKRRKKLCMCI